MIRRRDRLDPVEREFELAIRRAMQYEDNDEAYWLFTGLREYRTYYKDKEPEHDDADR